MKSLLLSLGLLGASGNLLSAQNRVSIAPVYWFNYGLYSYRVHSVYNGLDTQVTGHDVASSAGLTARYHFTSNWDVSVGLLYNWNSSRLTSPPHPYGENRPFPTEAIQVPVSVNYRLTDRRLSPYFSAGALFVKSKTFTEAPIKTNGIVGIGFDYRFHSGLSLLVQPTVSYLFYKPANDAFFEFTKYSSYSLGLQTQLIWHF